MFRSRTMRRVKVRTPKGESKLYYRPRKTSKSKCRDCRAVLSGMAPRTSSKLKKSKTQRRPQRPYGGVLCTQCLRKLMVKKAQEMVMKDG